MMPTVVRTSILALVLTPLMAGCFSDDPMEPGDGPVSFSQDIQPVFTGGCAFSGCHGTSPNPPEKPMMLSQGQAYDNIVGVSAGELPSMNRIEPGQPDNSYLVHKIQGTQADVGGSGDRMPLGTAPLPQTTIDLIRRWVQEGAERN